MSLNAVVVVNQKGEARIERGHPWVFRSDVVQARGAEPGAVVRVAALYVGRASDVHEATLAPSGAGEYATELAARHAGQWELRFDVRAGSAHFTEVARVEARSVQ